MLRGMALVMIVAGCALCGMSFVWESERRLRLLRLWRDDLTLLKINLIERLEPTQSALSLCRSDWFRRAAEYMDGEDSLSAWKRVCREKRGSADAEALLPFFERLGRGGRAEQAAEIEACLRALEERIRDAADHAARARRLYPSIGLLAGFAAAVMLI